MKIPETIAAFIHATNTQNTSELLSAFTDTAILTDEGHDYRGISAIKEWFEKKCIRAMITLKPMKTVERSGMSIVTFTVDGNFDKTGLPDPLQLDFHFTLDSNRVAALSIRFPESVIPN